MKFKETNADQLVEKVNQLKNKPKDDKFCSWMIGSVFYQIYPDNNKNMSLKNQYKPKNFHGAGTILNQKIIRAQSEALAKANEKLLEKGFYGKHYNNDDSSFKLHLNLNNIGDIDDSVILGLIQLLTNESESPENNMNFHFKIIDPTQYRDKRFANTDQITVYFDKYSSLGDMLNLNKKVEQYLKQHIPENKITMGEKESFCFNSFVSGRFDNNKLMGKYTEFKFFDLELKKFFETHQHDDLSGAPLFILEAVFNSIILSQNLTIDKNSGALDPIESQIVQSEFNLALDNPEGYVKKMMDKYGIMQFNNQMNTETSTILSTLIDINQIDVDFSTCNNETELMKKKSQLNYQIRGFVRTIDNELSLDRDILETASVLVKEKEAEIELQCNNRRMSFDNNQKIFKSIHLVEELLAEIKNNADTLSLQPKRLNDAKAINAIHDALAKQLNEFKPNYYKKDAYDHFRSECQKIINDCKPVLKKFDNSKALLVNIPIAIATAGVAHAIHYKLTKGQNTFFGQSNLKKNVDQIEDNLAEIDNQFKKNS